jgi:UDP-glucose 4-epimerase
MLELGRRILAVEGHDEDIALHPSPPGSVRRRAPALGKLRELTGFEERIPLDRGLRATADFYLRDRLQPMLEPDAEA